ncbi:MAG: carbohydrate ABC transporter permease [Christensenellales bacterium]|jgi:putative aldouronate transport system permease protein
MAQASARRIKTSHDDKLLYIIVYSLLTLILIVTLYPIVFVVSASFSDPIAISAGRVVLWPVGFSLRGYQVVLEDARVSTGFLNSLFYTTVGTGINLFMTLLAAYPLSRRDLPGRKQVMMFCTATMLFSGGMIPSYILMRDLNLLDTRWSLLLPTAISVYNMIVARTFFMTTIPDELLEASQIDGCSDFRFLISVVLPLSKAITAVLIMYYAVGHWNSYFNAFLYLNSKNLFPLQLVLREILVMSQISAASIEDADLAIAMQGLADLLKYALIIVSSLPVLLLYPLAQKYFVEGIMIGSIKG